MWEDKRSVAFLSTNCAPEGHNLTVKRCQKDGMLKDVATKYNKFMGGVDLADQLRRSYSISWKSKKWWRRIFFFVIDQAICNAYILCWESPNHQRHYVGKDKTQKSRPVKHLEFQKALAKQLMGDFTCRKRPLVPEMQPDAGHWPKKMKKGNCRHCCRNGRRSRVTTGCERCNINICIDCFKPYHK